MVEYCRNGWICTRWDRNRCIEPSTSEGVVHELAGVSNGVAGGIVADGNGGLLHGAVGQHDEDEGMAATEVHDLSRTNL